MQQDTIGKVNFRIQKSFTPLELVCRGPLDLQTRLLQSSWLAIRERIIKLNIIENKNSMNKNDERVPTFLIPIGIQVNPNNP